MPQVKHALPLFPHWVADGGVRHDAPAQQPDGHDAALHTHVPATQAWPGAQALPPPHRHWPPLQLSLRRPHATHAPPLEPQLAVEAPDWQTPPEQQPDGHDVASQTQVPARHRWPALHAAPPPQRHWPPLQVSDVVALQAMQAAPLVPQAEVEVPAWQTPPAQHPEGHDVELHPAQAPDVQVWPVTHIWHAPPPVPHALVEVPAWQEVPAQQPEGHEVASQTQVPETHRWPALHTAPPVPQLQVPPRQRSAFAPHAVQALPALPHCAVLVLVTQVVPLQHPVGHEVASQRQMPPAQRWPAPHAGPAPQRHWPPLQVLAVLPQATHVVPPPPHCDVEVLVTHVEPLQHPEGHEVASHTQVPDRQRWPVPHAAPPPHRQAPPRQVSAVAPQLVQVTPLTPQADAELPATHDVPLQQPAQVALSQTQVPPEQRWPTLHAAPPPHRHCPLVQRSASRVLQVLHALPDAPQSVVVVPPRQAPERQHPEGHVVELHPWHVLLLQI